VCPEKPFFGAVKFSSGDEKSASDSDKYSLRVRHFLEGLSSPKQPRSVPDLFASSFELSGNFSVSDSSQKREQRRVAFSRGAVPIVVDIPDHCMRVRIGRIEFQRSLGLLERLIKVALCKGLVRCVIWNGCNQWI
jgi:hypothetical protein